MTLDGHIRLMDASTGKMLNDFKGHTHSSYRCRAVFGHGEATVACGDEAGSVWAWDLLDVRFSHREVGKARSVLLMERLKATTLQPNPPPKVHHKVITWIEHHPSEVGEVVTASADGTVKVWRYPDQGS
jgi:mitogen-activated protein kinase organizer 1